MKFVNNTKDMIFEFYSFESSNTIPGLILNEMMDRRKYRIGRQLLMCVNFDRPSWDEYFMLQAELAKLR